MMILDLLIRLVLATIFFSTAISKVLNFRQHAFDVSNYNILNPSLIKPFIIICVLIELLISISLIFLLSPLIPGILAVVVLLTYTTAIAINLMRKNTDLNCGCGGVLSESKLSIKLIFRNSFIILITVLMILFSTNSQVSIENLAITQYLATFLTAIILLIASMTFNALGSISSILKNNKEGI